MQPRAYYNEIDDHAAAWLRALIQDGMIPDGDVDERSIVDVQRGDLIGYTQVHMFAGIGGWPYALRLAGWPDDRDCWTGSPPCQPWSVAGKQRGKDDERDLWPEFYRLIDALRPQVIFGEQVSAAARATAIKGKDLQSLHGAQALQRILRRFQGSHAKHLLGLCEGTREAPEGWFEGFAVGDFQEMEEGKPSGGADYRSKIPGQTEGSGLRSGRVQTSFGRTDQSRDLRADGTVDGSQYAQSVEQSITPQGVSRGRVYDNQRDGGPVFYQRDDECVGVGESPRGSRRFSDECSETTTGTSGGVGSEPEAASSSYWLDRVYFDLERSGYTCRATDIPACAVDAPNRRQRLYFVATRYMADTARAGSPRRHGGAVQRLAEPGRSQVEPQRRDGSSGILLADADRSGRDGWSDDPLGEQERRAFAEWLDEGCPLEHATSVGRGEGRSEHGVRSGRRPSSNADAQGDVADDHRAVVQGQPPARQQPYVQSDAGDHGQGGVGHADSEGLEVERGQPSDVGAERAPVERTDVCDSEGSFWSDAVWIQCHDGKKRRAKPGIPLLVDGVPGRVSLWRGFGNAINPQLAAQVIAAFMETEL